jgi:hypothetical protein
MLHGVSVGKEYTASIPGNASVLKCHWHGHNPPFLGCARVMLQVGRGPNGVGMTLHNLTCRAWDIVDSVLTTQSAVAPRLSFPEGAPMITTANKAGPLVQSVRSCADLQVIGVRGQDTPWNLLFWHFVNPASMYAVLAVSSLHGD